MDDNRFVSQSALGKKGDETHGDDCKRGHHAGAVHATGTNEALRSTLKGGDGAPRNRLAAPVATARARNSRPVTGADHLHEAYERPESSRSRLLARGPLGVQVADSSPSKGAHACHARQP